MCGELGAVAHPPLLEVDGAARGRPGIVHAALRVVHDDMGLRALVGHREEADAWAPAIAECLGDGREGEAGVEHLRAHQVGGDVAVAQTEPRGLEAVGGQLLLDGEGLRLTAPAALLGDAVAQGVHHRVEVRAHAQAVDPDVVAGIADDGHLGVRGCGQQPAKEASAADPPCEHGDAAQRCRGRRHGHRVSRCRPRRRGSSGRWPAPGGDRPSRPTRPPG